MKTTTEIRLTITNEERQKLREAYEIINDIRAICSRTFDDVSFRCWDSDQDYVEFNKEQLFEFTNFIHDVFISNEVGFYHTERNYNDKR